MFPSNPHRLVAVALVVALMATACGGGGDDATSSPSVSPEPPSVDADDTGSALGDLAASFEAVGDPEADVVIINTQGGPVTELALDELDDLGGLVDLDETYVITVHQAQTADPDRFTIDDLSFDQAKAAVAESVETLAAVVRHFDEQGRRVFVVGISFGAFMLQELLATQGPIADGYLAMVGRLDINEEVWTEFAEGRAAGFVDGTEVVTVPIEDAGMGSGTEAGDRNMARLAAGLGHHRYTDRLGDVDLSSLIYVYGDLDEQVGRLTAGEVAFLESKGATVWRSDRGHGGAADEFLAAGLAELVGADAIVAPAAPAESAAELPSTDSLAGDAILTDDHIGTLALGAELLPLDDAIVEFALDLELPEVPAGPALVGFVGDTVVVVPLDLETEGPTGVIAVLTDRDVFVGELTTFDEDDNGFLLVEGSTASLLTGDTLPVAASLGLGVGTSTFEIDGTDAIVRGALGARTLDQIEHLIADHPDVDRLVLQSIEGSVNDEVNVVTVARIREAGLDTHVPADGEIYSGGVDLFAGGVRRTAEPGATIGVHAWCCGVDGESAHLIPVDDPAHDHQRTLFAGLLGAEQGDRFYFFTLQAAPFDGIEVMTPLEWEAFDLVSTDEVLREPSPLAIARVAAADVDAAVEQIREELAAQGRTVDVLVAIGGAEPTAVLALDADSGDAAVVALDFDATADGVELVDATIAEAVG